jgi:NTP pyrophosphatase (non-canonical NTP hydrolase)
MIKKWVFHEKELDVEHVKKEIGDIYWYIAMMCESFGFDMDEVMQMNIEKLQARYPDGFDTVRANNRSEEDL